MKKYVEALRLYEELYQKEPRNLNYRYKLAVSTPHDYDDLE
ncbi:MULTISPECIES: hypothetical protein [Aeribacillus]|jgi:hypothetical protein|nr:MULTISPECIES: hypothetical protein [Aeribacillus]MED0651063.1 hypothetical protein [Aeribacillus composti]MED0716030.1 hypothetical protein [Aeribacillus composti]MED4487655.1 hypothetical protein [Aeribacillus pallidus]